MVLQKVLLKMIYCCFRIKVIIALLPAETKAVNTRDKRMALRAMRTQEQRTIITRKAISKSYRVIPVLRQVYQSNVQKNFGKIKEDVQNVIETEMEAILNDPSRASLVVSK